MLNRLIGTFVLVVWSLWFGGVMALFAFVLHLFKADRALAVRAAPVLFHTTEKLQLFVAAAALIGTFVWYLTGRSKGKIAFFVLLILAGIGAGILPTLITPHMDALQAKGLSSTPEFGKWHGIASSVYLSEAILLFVGGIVAICVHSAPRKSSAV